MLNSKKIPDAELEIMMVIWDADKAVNSDYIMKELQKTWTKPTLLNLLNRLYERGFVDFYKEGKFKMYSAKVARDDYIKKESGNFLKKMHRNSVTSLIASLYDGGNISAQDLEELEKFIKEAK